MKIELTNDAGTFNITQLVATAKWSGDKRQAVRTLNLEVIATPSDPSVPVVDWKLGGVINLFVNEDHLFHGKILTRDKSVESLTISLLCQDGGRHLVRNKVMKKYTSRTPEYIAEQLANEFGIKIGSIIKTGISISRLFLSGNDSIYDVMITAYNLAAKTTKKKYHIGFRGEMLFISEITKGNRTLVVKAKSNLISANVSESVASIVSEVQIYNTEDKLINTLKDDERTKAFDLVRQVIKQTKKDNKTAEAQKILDNSGVEQKISVDMIGNVACVTGGTVVVEEPYTGLYGLFYIDADVHEWKRGQYYNKLTLNFKNIMDEKEVGTLPNADGQGTVSRKSSTTTTSKVKKKFVWVNDQVTGKELEK